MKPYTKLGTIGRFKPLHLGGKLMLEALCQHSDQAIIGIGSSNRYNARNPFTAAGESSLISSATAISPRTDERFVQRQAETSFRIN